MKNIKEETYKTTLKKPVNKQSQGFEKNFKKTMISTAPSVNLNEVDELLTEKQQSLKKKIFSLSKMESLVFSDPKLTAVYDEMAENGEEKYGYHYNETIMNMIFNDYVLNSSKYLQKYKMAIPKKKKRRDQSGINQLKKDGQEKMTQSGLPKDVAKPGKEISQSGLPKSDVIENVEPITKVQFLVNERDPENADVFAYFPEENHDSAGKYKTGYSHIGQHSAVDPQYAAESRPATPEEYADLKAELEGNGYNLEVIENGINETTSASSAGGAAGYVGYAGPAAWGSGDLMKTKGKSNVMRKPIFPGGTVIQESNYLTDPSGFNEFIRLLESEDVDGYIIDKSNAFSSDAVKQWENPDKKIQMDTINTGVMDKPNFESMEESVNNFEAVKSEAQRISREEGVAQHVNRISNDRYEVSDWYDADKTEISFENGRELNEMNNIDEKAKSQSQQQFMGMVHAIQKGELSPNEVSPKMRKVAKEMNPEDTEDFARTKHKGLPEKVDEDTLNEFYQEALIDDDVVDTQPRSGEKPFMFNGEKYQYETATYADGRKDLVVYSFTDDVYYDYTKWRKLMGLNEDTQTMIQNNGTSMSNKATPNGDQASGLPMGIQASGGIQESDENEMSLNPAQDAANAEYQSPSDRMYNSDAWVQAQRDAEGIDESFSILEEVNNELEAFSIHHNKLMKMSEDRKPSALVLRDRLGSENEKNFKSDMQGSDTKQVINVEKELQYKDQQTDVKDPQKLTQDIEKTEIKATDAEGDEALKNVGDSANDSGDEIPKRNLKDEEQNEVNMYRLGQHSLIYDNEPGKRFEDRMKADMGDDIYKMRQEQMKFRAKAPMYNKDPQPVEDTTSDKVQFNKEQSTWNERVGLKEAMITGRYRDALNKSHIVDFNLNEVKELKTSTGTAHQTGLFELDFTGLGNSYESKTINYKVNVNESAVKAISNYKFYTDGREVFAMKNLVKKINEGKVSTEKPIVSEQVNKMKHLLGYKPDKFVSTKNIKNNRGF